MQKNLLIKLVIIVGTLLVFLYGIFGIPSSLSGKGWKEAMLSRIHLGLDLKGGTHLILQVQVNDAVNAETDNAIETLKDGLRKANVNHGEITKPDPTNHPEQIVIKGAPPEGATALRDLLSTRLSTYDA